jgi:hypothetical protein
MILVLSLHALHSGLRHVHRTGWSNRECPEPIGCTFTYASVMMNCLSLHCDEVGLPEFNSVAADSAAPLAGSVKVSLS